MSDRNSPDSSVGPATCASGIRGERGPGRRARPGPLLALACLLSVWGCSAPVSGSAAAAPAGAAFAVASADSVDLSRHFEGLEATFVLLDARRERWVYHNPDRARTRFLPASTFKIPNSLIGLETGVVSGADFTLDWDSIRAPREAWWPRAWAGPNDLRSAFRNSVVWYYQEVARRIGPERMNASLQRFRYGNADYSAGIDQFWLTGGFGISAEEQVEFLRRFHGGKLGVSARSAEIIRDIMLLDEAADHRLSGKTGTARLPDGRMLAWLVGYVEREGEVYFYALNFEGERDRVWNEWQGPRRVAVTRAILRQLGVLPGADAFATIAEVDRLAAQDLWPGFDPRTVPVAIYDGERTLLFRHPSPPDGFVPLPDRAGVAAHPGRHPSVTANSSVELGGVRTATLMPSSRGASLLERAGLLVHESFHVFQREHHPTWTANEAELFTYPADDAGPLALRRLETEALHRALTAREPEPSACWAHRALELRRERFAALPPGSVAYERGSELNEGLATYVEHRAIGTSDDAVLRDRHFAPDAVRQRSYRSGLALARLLDRFSSDWREVLMRSGDTSLDRLLVAALATRTASRSACAFTSAEREAALFRARTDVAALRSHRAEQRRAYLEQDGWRLSVLAAGAPLFPQGFDPLNVQAVGSGEVLHTRFLKLGNPAGEVEVLGRSALTEAAGAHPLFNGVRALHLYGLGGQPTVREADGVVVVEAEGIRAELRGAAVERSGQTITVRVPG